MATIPASEIVNIIPGVLNAGGNALVFNGIMLTENNRVPIGEVLSFPPGNYVADFFGPSAPEVHLSNIYFNGFDNSTQKPASVFFTQYNQASVPAYMRGGPVDQLTLAQLKALTGSLSIVVDGYTWSVGSVVLSSATSFSAAAALIQAALIASVPQAALFTGVIAPETVSITASIAGFVLTVNSVTGTIVPGTILSGGGVVSNTEITSQLSGTTGGIGTYSVNTSQVLANSSISGSYGMLTVAPLGVTSGTLSVGQTIVGSGVTANTQITGLGTGTGLDGTYYVQFTQTVSSPTNMTADGTAPTVTFDSISGGFVVTSGIVGPASTMAYATGTIATSIYLTQQTGAVLSQGATAADPVSFMAALTNITQNWVSFMTTFDPDAGSGNTQKQLFSSWVNSIPTRYVYVAWDNDISPTLAVPAPSSLGNILQTDNSSGTACIYAIGGAGADKAAFICGTTASIDFQAFNGRITFMGKHQTGLIADVTSGTVAENLAGAPQTAGSYGNGYNFYGAYATANENFVFFNRGTVSGPFLWLDSYVNAIWISNGFQLALIELLTTVNSIPYNKFGNTLIEAACMDQINAALHFGAIRAGVILSQAQIAEVNSAAGIKIDDVLNQSGWYLQVLADQTQPIVRQGRASPVCNFWYMDGESVQAITLNSIDIQ